MNTIITLTQPAAIDGYKGDFLREFNANGDELATGLWDAWYTAPASDDEGRAYQVFWSIRGEYDASTGDESDACDWASPWMILDEDNRNVTAYCSIRF